MQAIYVTHSGDDLLVVNSARVSFDKVSEYEQETEDACKALKEADIKLLTFLAKNGHWTPFAHPSITLHIEAPIFVRTQCFKHKVGFTENEVSRRYIDTPPTTYHPIWRARAEDKKQGSRDEFPKNVEHCDHVYSYTVEVCKLAYAALLKEGVCPEQARMVLPQSMMTQWYWTGSLAAYYRFYQLRTAEHAQKEIQELAHMVGDIIKPLYPYSWRALHANSR